jgi:hypothetical protein
MNLLAHRGNVVLVEEELGSATPAVANLSVIVRKRQDSMLRRTVRVNRLDDLTSNTFNPAAIADAAKDGSHAGEIRA